MFFGFIKILVIKHRNKKLVIAPNSSKRVITNLVKPNRKH